MIKNSGNKEADFYGLLPSFIKKFFHGKVNTFDFQCWHKGRYVNKGNGVREKEVGYETQPRPLTQADLYKHFYEDARDKDTKFYGSLSLGGIFENNIVKVISIDIDDADQMVVWNSRLKPFLESKDIDYFIEWGGFEDDGGFTRCHILIFLDAIEFSLAKDFCRCLFYYINEPIFANEIKHFDNYGRKNPLYDEVFPINKPNNKIRPPGGYHMRRDRRYPCEYSGQLLITPIEILKGIKACKSVTKDFINGFIDKEIIAKLDSDKIQEKTKALPTSGKFYYEPRKDLDLPVSGLPAGYIPLVKNCQAIHDLLEDIVMHDGINTPGQSHDPGLYICASLLWQDVQFKNTLGHEFFFGDLCSNYRDSSPADHNWDYYGYDRAYILTCKSWDEKFGLCDGCPYKGLITSPRELIPSKWNIPIKKNLVDKMRLTTYDEIRQKEFPVIEDYIVNLVLDK